MRQDIEKEYYGDKRYKCDINDSIPLSQVLASDLTDQLADLFLFPAKFLQFFFNVSVSVCVISSPGYY